MKRLPICTPLLCILFMLAMLCLEANIDAQTVTFYETGEEFAGPFPSWKNVRVDYGAKGDGITDDTPAIQAAIDDLRNMPGNRWSTLYFPAGVYRIEKTFVNRRREHNDWLGCQIIGEDPARTILQWHGREGQWMWGLDAWYCKVSRFTFDGRGIAGTGLMRWNNFSTYCELSDLWFKDIKGAGICLGSNTNNHEGQAEHAVERCRFMHCGTGILTADWNTMDIYIWWCLFEDCGRGVHNNMGGYQAFENVFLRSKESDLSTQNNHVFNIVNNTSGGSKRFIGIFAARGYVQGNKIYDTLEPIAMPATDCMIDNLVRSREGNTGPCVKGGSKNHFFAGNTFTVTNPISTGSGRTLHLAQKIVEAGTVNIPTTLRLPGPPPNKQRKVFEVRPGTGDDAKEIQQQIEAAASDPNGANPVVHLPKGKFTLRETIVLPANKALQIVGDGGSENGTVIAWNGKGAGPGFRLLGPSRVTLRDLSFSFVGSGVDAVVIENSDQPGGRIFCDQVLCGGNDASKRCEIALLVDGLEQSDVSYLNGGWGEFTRGGVVVKGGPVRKSGGKTGGQVSLLLGALGNNESRLIDVQDGGRVVACGFRDETPKPGALVDLGPDSAGAISIMGMSWAATPSTTQPFIRLDGYKGTLAYVGNYVGSGYKENDGSFFLQVGGDGRDTRVLSAANEFTSRHSTNIANVWRDTSNPKAQAMLINCVGGGVNQKQYDIPNVVGQIPGALPDEKAVLEMLEQIRELRTEPPVLRREGVTDVKLHRVLVRASQGRMGLVLRRGETTGLKARLSWGHRSESARPFRISFGTNTAVVKQITLEALESGDRLEGSVCETRAGAGDIDEVTVEVSWSQPTKPPRKAHSIWQHLLDKGTPGQVARLKDDPGLTPDAPVLTVLTADDGTRGFSIGLEQLARHKAMWLPEHDVFVTLADAPVDFATHLASLKGERVLDVVKHGPEATLAEWTNKWADFGDPTRPHHGQETGWLGTKGHLTGMIAGHGSVYKFGVDRWASVRPDYASPHKFRFDLLWPGCKWAGQRIVNGLPIIATSLERQAQRCEIEQFAAPLRAMPRDKRGEVASVFFTRIEASGTGAMSFGFRLATENTNRHPELRQVGGHMCVVDRETGAVWLMIEAGPGWSVKARALKADAKDPLIEFDCSGQIVAGEGRQILLKLPSPALAADAVAELAALDFSRSRADSVSYWENWLAQGARFEVPEPTVNALFRANLWHALMLPRHRTDGRGIARIDLPYSNFAYGQLNADWPINQAVYVDYMIYGLRGHYAVAEEEFAAMYHSQQKPDGRIGGYAEWGVYSPGMLYSIAQNFLLSRDRASFERLLPASMKALDWCLREVARGKNSKEAPGLIVAPLNDLTHDSRAWGFPNGYFVAGLEMFGRALAAYGHTRAAEVCAAAKQMRTDVERAFARASVRSPVVQLADGTWNNYVPCDAMTPRRLLDAWYPTDVDCGPLHMARLAAIDPRGWLASAMLHDHEDNLFLNQWGMANEPVYNQQASAYLYRDEPEAAIRAFYSMMACAFSHHQLTPLEHRWAWGQYYMPPSTDGAWFELYRNMLLNELSDAETLFIGQAVPRAWLANGNGISIEKAPTYFGPVNVHIESAPANGSISAKVEFLTDRRPRTLLVRLRHPARKGLRSVTVNGAQWKDFDAVKEWVRIPNATEARYNVSARY